MKLQPILIIVLFFFACGDSNAENNSNNNSGDKGWSLGVASPTNNTTTGTTNNNGTTNAGTTTGMTKCTVVMAEARGTELPSDWKTSLDIAALKTVEFRSLLIDPDRTVERYQWSLVSVPLRINHQVIRK